MPQPRPSRPYTLSLSFRGEIQGLTYLDSTSSAPLCHYFGGVPYGLPPKRFQKPKPLAPCYRYGTKVSPGVFAGNCGLCPQATRAGMEEDKWEEDCLQCNVWVPVGKVPEGGWPVLFYIHGGFLQFGNPNDMDFRAFLSDSPARCIVVAPAYRLNLFGFLSSPELLAACPDFNVNLGFWDQRLALQWTFENISYFGGNPGNITLCGYSAGAHSVFHQLAYDLNMPDNKAFVKRAMMLSNGPGVQPKSLDEAQLQFNELLAVLSIPLTLSPADKLARLRALPAKRLVEASTSINLHQFRAVTDSTFVQPDLLSSLTNGTFARRLIARNTPLILGECADEHFLYGLWKPPAPGYHALSTRLLADYPSSTVKALMRHYFPSRSLPPRFLSWQAAFGHVYADTQIHALQRGVAHSLVQHGAGHLLYRYRIEWRAACVDAKISKEYGVTHTSDLPIWFWGDGGELSSEEKDVIGGAFQEPLGRFLVGEEIGWGCGDGKGVRTLKGDGRVVIEKDRGLEEGVRLWDALCSGGEVRVVRESKL